MDQVQVQVQWRPTFWELQFQDGSRLQFQDPDQLGVLVTADSRLWWVTLSSPVGGKERPRMCFMLPAVPMIGISDTESLSFKSQWLSLYVGSLYFPVW